MSASPTVRPVERRILLNVPNHEVRASTRSTSYSTPKGLLAQTRARDRDPVLGSAALCARARGGCFVDTYWREPWDYGRKWPAKPTCCLAFLR
jgi:hypothetical protein